VETSNRETPRSLWKSFQIIKALQQSLENRKTHKKKKKKKKKGHTSHPTTNPN